MILDNVQRRTLKDSVTLTGTLAREEQRKVTSVTQGRLSAMYAKDGQTSPADDRLFAIDGRDAITEPGDIEFFRPLTVGDQGDDVVQLKEILATSGFNPGFDGHALHRTDPLRARRSGRPRITTRARLRSPRRRRR